MSAATSDRFSNPSLPSSTVIPCTGTQDMQQIEFNLEAEFVELNQLLKLVGLCDSGGAGKMLVATGDVSVDGKTELRKTCKIRAGQIVRIGDIRIRVHAG
jgi:ribosome-associated protein